MLTQKYNLFFSNANGKKSFNRIELSKRIVCGVRAGPGLQS